MKRSLKSVIPFNLIILAIFLFAIIGGNKVITVISENSPVKGRSCIVIDAGHGGEDGGAISCTGVLESNINLSISLRLEDLLHLLGYNTLMIRRTDRSVYTSGDTIAARKVSDLKERVRIINETENAVLVSIHQNYFSSSKYHGAQVFYSNESSRVLAEKLQSVLVDNLNPGSNRKCKYADGIYLMDHIQCVGVLIECGFLSNQQEEAKLNDPDYQKLLCCTIASVIGDFISLDGQINA